MHNNIDFYPLTHPQKAVWFTEKLHPGTSIGNVAATLRMKGTIDFSVLEKAINLFIKNNDSMRLRIIEIDGEPKQYFSEYQYHTFETIDFSGMDINELYKWDSLQSKTPLELIDSDLFYFVLIKLSDNDNGFYVKCHHLIADAWSMNLLGSRIMHIYYAMKGESEIPELYTPSYTDFMMSEDQYMASNRYIKDQEYWDKIFESFPERTILKADPPEHTSIKARRKTMIAPKKLTARIYQYCYENKTSVFSLFVAALSMYINRVTDKNDIILGTTTLNRLNTKEKETVGMFNNIVPIRIDMNDNMNFRTLIENVSREGLKLLRHQKYPYDYILKSVREKHQITDNIFNIVLIYQNTKLDMDHIKEEFSSRWHFNGYQVDSLHISINDRENEGNLIIDYDYQTDLFHAKEIDFIHQNIINVLWHALDDPAKTVSRLEMLSEKEKCRILREFNKTKIICPDGLETDSSEEYHKAMLRKIPAQTKSYILDKNLNLMPIGIAGDLFISGKSISNDRRKELVFLDGAGLPNPYSDGDRLYRTGYKARWYPDGDILYLGSVVPGNSLKSERIYNKSEIVVDILSTFTAEPVESYIKWWGRQFGYHLKINFAGYNQIFQELLNPESLLSKNNDGINVILIRFEDFIRYENGSDEEKISILEKTQEELKDAFGSFESKASTVVGIFPLAPYLDMSIVLQQKIEKISMDFKRALEKHKNVFILDFCEMQAIYGIHEVFDSLQDKEAHMPFTEEYYAAMGTELARKVCAIRKQTLKVIVLDCDNTLWKGICGEQGALGVHITEPYRQLQQFMLQKYQEGFLLAVCSKNNEKDVLEVFEKNPGMILEKKHFISWKINWKEKSINIKEIAEDLNLGLDSFIFVDDNPLECSKMAESCPEVLTLQLPYVNEYIPLFLKHVWAFDKVRITNEDILRNEMYEAEAKRKTLQNANSTFKQFMHSLHLKVSMRVITDDEIERAAQLTHRTNQFNLSTIRRSEEELTLLLENKSYTGFVVEASDRFGDYGIIGLVLLYDDREKIFIDTFLMSCRIFGRNVENVMLAGIGRFARERKRERIEAAFVSTEKNKPTYEFIILNKWELLMEADKRQLYCIKTEELKKKVEGVEFYYNKKFADANADGLYKGNVCLEHKAGETAKTHSSSFLPQYDPDYNVESYEHIRHKEYILPLKYLTAKKLLQISYGYCSDATLSGFNTSEDGKQEKLLHIWKRLLKTDKIEIEDDFFKLGGDSLSAVILLSNIRKEFGVELALKDVFRSGTIKKLAQIIAGSSSKKEEHIEPVEPKAYYDLSSAQKRMYILNKMEGHSTVYNECHRILIEGKLDRNKLESAFQQFVNRHEIMRTGFEMIESGPVQIVYDDVDFKIPFAKVKEEDVLKVTDEFIQPFDLRKPPLIRASLLEVAKERHILLLDVHHIIIDGASFGILIKEIQALYRGSALRPLRIQYKDFANWQNKYLVSNAIKKQEEYWKQQFSDGIPVLNMPTDHPRPAVQSFHGRWYYFKLDSIQTDRLKSICGITNTTLFMLLYAAFNVLLHRYSSQEDIVVGIPVSGRNHEDVKNIAGMFVNTLPIRTSPKSNCKFSEYLEAVKETILKGLENQDYQYENLVDKLSVQRELNRNPLFDILFSMQNTDIPDIQLDGLSMKQCKVDSHKSKFDLSLLAAEKNNELEFGLEYCTDLFEEYSILRLKDHFLNILKDVSDNLQKPISEIEILSEEEKNKILYEFNSTQADYPRDKTIHQLFEEQAAKTPDDIAVVFENKELTYSRLNTRANQLAALLRDKGVEPGVIVGIMVNRSLELVVGILAILKAGGAYLPVDPGYPEERIRYMLEDSGMKLLLTSTALNRQASFDDMIYINECFSGFDDGVSCFNLTNLNKSSDLLYVVYTSGSTGQPKGVMLEHRNMANLIHFQYTKTGINFKERTMQFASMSFDVCSQEIFSALLTGGTLAILSDRDKNRVNSMCEFIRVQNISVMFLPTAFFKFLASQKDYLELIPESVKHIIVAGEKLTLNEYAKDFFKNRNISLHNHYGPAETHVVTTYSMDKNTMLKDIPYIGKPISNTQIYILDSLHHVQPIGIYGEIYIAGDNVGRGYANKTDLTMRRFKTIEMGKTKIRCYQTGDVGRWIHDGNIEFLGRNDNQVKIRGYRVELEEVEKCFLKHAGIRECVVITRKFPNGNTDLVAYFTSDEVVDIDSLKSTLKKHLPIYMIPKYYMQVEKIQLTKNGKVNKDNLPNLIMSPAKNNYTPPASEKEKELLKVWRSVLGIDDLSIEHNFFENGGDSLLLIKVLLEAEKKGYEITVKDMYLKPSVKELCRS